MTLSDRTLARFRATVEYDGTHLKGFQRQGQGERTVQEELERAILRISEQSATVIGAGRTDSGVHAVGQIIAFDIVWQHGCSSLERAINANLPDDVAVRNIIQAASRFHPRFDASSREYKYLINNQYEPAPLQRLTMWHILKSLDVDAMNSAAAHLVGEHDFAAFGSAPVGNNTVRKVMRADWQRNGNVLSFIIEANAFLYHMVRSIVGTMRLVGSGEMSPDRFEQIIASADRSQAGPTAPPHGLCLIKVNYEH